MYAVANRKILYCEDEFFTFYEKRGIDLRNISLGNTAWFDDEVMLLMKEYGMNLFHKEDIWHDKFKKLDCRKLKDKLVHFWLRLSNNYSQFLLTKKIDAVLKRRY
jgi:hypothetical protein